MHHKAFCDHGRLTGSKPNQANTHTNTAPATGWDNGVLRRWKYDLGLSLRAGQQALHYPATRSLRFVNLM